jgi:hypothetical protein
MKFPLSTRGGALLVAFALLLAPVRAQRPAPQPAPKPAAATTTPAERSPSATFDTLLSADAYGIYAEVRAVGRHAGSQEIAQLLAPFNFDGSGAPEEMTALYEFIKSHADALTTARLMFATMPARAGLPETLLALEMPSAEEARKFVPELRRFVAVNIAPPSKPAPASTETATINATLDAPNATRRRGRRRGAQAASAGRATDAARAKQPAAPQFQLKRAGNLIAMSGASFTFRDLRGGDRALLVDEPGFQATRARFNTDTLFVYFNTVRMTSSSKQHAEALEKEYRRQEKLAQAQQQKQNATTNANMSVAPDIVIDNDGNARMDGNMNTANMNAVLAPEETPPPPAGASPEPTPTPMSEKELEEERRREQSRQFTESLASFVFGARGDSGGEAWPESIGVGASLDGDALVVRGLFVSLSGDQPLRPIPFLPVLLSGPAIASEASRVLPADTDICLSVSLDLPQMYDYVASLMKISDLVGQQKDGTGGFGEQLSAFEKTNDFRIREDLLAALGNEVGIGMPGSGFFGSRSVPKRADDASPPSGPIVVIALNDRESLQKLLPRVLNAFGFAGATEQSIVEKHGEVEVLTFSNGTLAFIDRFLVGTPDAATMRRVTDAYNSGETLANSERFRDATSWQSRQAIGQVYIANDMLKGMFEDVTKSVEDIEDPAIRAYLARLDPEPGAVTHLVTRESDGLMHELRLPKNLLSLFAASGLVRQQLSAMRDNEYIAQSNLRIIHSAQEAYKTATGRYGTLEELTAAQHIPEHNLLMELSGYEIKLSVSGDKFEATATPTGYPKLGRRSFYIDQTGSLRGGDTGGKPATESTPIID